MPARGAISGAGPRLLRGVRLAPAEVLARWPAGRPLACLWADSGVQGRPWARWTIIAEPTECRVWPAMRTREEVLGAWRGMSAGGAFCERADEIPPFAGGWIGYVGYGVGGAFEPAARGGCGPEDDRGWAPGAWVRCPAALAHDGWTGKWWAVGQGDGAGWLDGGGADGGDDGFVIGALTSRMGRAGFEAAVMRAVEYIRAGDVFQVNLAHRLSGAFSGSARGLFRALVERARPRHGAYLEVPEGAGVRAVVSASPELFLSFDAGTRVVMTRPMKGTRAARSGGSGYPELERSGKDRAELAMIVDLMRNDLGRVCEFGSVRVAEARVIERHGPADGGVFQGVATVRARLREGLDTGDLLCATFPGGSVTGAPKIRAMQIIEELEPVARGPYCGAIGMVSDSGDVMLNIAIRTALIADGRLDYSVGAGIVAESEPGAEWAETMEKARVILSLAGG